MKTPNAFHTLNTGKDLPPNPAPSREGLARTAEQPEAGARGWMQEEEHVLGYTWKWMLLAQLGPTAPPQITTHPIHPTAIPKAHKKQGKCPKSGTQSHPKGTTTMHSGPCFGCSWQARAALPPAAREAGGRPLRSSSASSLYITLKNFPCTLPALPPSKIPLINSGEN